MRAVQVALLASDQAHTRLFRDYGLAVQAHAVNETVEIEVPNLIRAVRAAVEMLINGLHLEIVDSSSRGLFFPTTAQRLQEHESYRWLDREPALMSIFAQAVTPPLPLTDLSARYRSAAHHGNIEYRTLDRNRQVVIDELGRTVMDVDLDGPNPGVRYNVLPVHEFAGVPVKITLPEGAVADGLGDLFFTSDNASVMGWLTDLQNQAVGVYRAVAATRQWELTGFDLSTVILRPG